MARRIALPSWLAIAGLFVLLSRPAEAYIIGSLFYSEGYAASYTALDFADYAYGAMGAYVDSTLSFDGNEIGYDQDDESGKAYAWNEDDVGAGEYAVAGDHWIYYYPDGWWEVGTSWDTFDDGGGGDGGGGPTPTCEVSSGSAYEGIGGQFFGCLGYLDEDSVCEPTNDSTFYGGGVVEDIEGIGSDCYDPTFTLGYIDDTFGWTVGPYSIYGVDYIWYDADWVSYFSSLVDSGFISPCSLWYGGQSLYYNGQPYWSNSVGIHLGVGSDTATRGVTVVFWAFRVSSGSKA